MDFIFEMLVLFVHSFVVLLIYRQCSGSLIKTKWLILVSLVFLFGFIYLPVFTYFVYLIFLVTYTLIRNKDKSRLLDIFYGLYPIIVESLFYRVLSFYIFPLLGFKINTIAESNFLNLIVELLIYPLYLFLTKALKINFELFKKGFKMNYLTLFLLILNVSMAVYLILIQVLLIFENDIAQSLLFRKYLVAAYIIFFLVMLVFLNASFTEKLESEILHQKDFQLIEMERYSQHIESLYQELRSFRHDYINILTSIKSGLELRDIDAIQKTYDDVLLQSGKKMNNRKYEIARLVNLNDSAIKSVLATKILEAQSREIKMSVEISENMTITMMENLDFITILAILCDNAIESAELSSIPSIRIALIQDDIKEMLVVENSTKECKIDLTSIFKRDFSTKGSYRGIGLSNMKDILEKYPHVTLSTKSNDFMFRQVIECKKFVSDKK